MEKQKNLVKLFAFIIKRINNNKNIGGIMRYSNYIYKLLTILVFGFCSASQFVVAEALTPQERTLISDFTSGINDFSLITEETCGSGSTQSFTYPILPSVPADVASAMEKALEYKEKEALANVAAVVLNYASKVRENYNTNLFLNWNNPLTKAYYRIKELIYGCSPLCIMKWLCYNLKY